MALENVCNQLYMDTHFLTDTYFWKHFILNQGFLYSMEHQLVFLEMLTSVLSFKN